MTTQKRRTARKCWRGVYRLNCEPCESVYFEETGKKFSARMKEHERSRVNEGDIS
jgi:hypothetical protein